MAVDGLTALLDEMTSAERVGVEALISEYRERRAGEAIHIAGLFDRLEQERFGPRFERWVARATGVDIDRLDPQPPT